MSLEEEKGILESIVEGVIVLREEQIIFANKSVCEMLGYSFNELISISINDLFPSNFYYNTFMKAIESKESVKYLELEMSAKKGLFSANFSISTYYDSNSQPLYKLILIRSLDEIENARQKGIDQFRLFAVQQLCLVLSRVESFGRGAVIDHFDHLPFIEDTKKEASLLLRLSIFYLTAVGQGAAYSTGLFGPLPIYEYDDYLALVFTFFLKNPENPDPRCKNQDYYLLMIIFPKSLENLFSNRKRIKMDLVAFFDEVEYTINLDVTNSEKIKKIITFGSKPGIPIEQRLLERKLAAITDLSTEITTILDIDTAFEYFTNFADKVLDFKLFAILLCDENRQTLKMISCSGYDKDLSDFELDLSSKSSTVVRCAREGSVINLNDVSKADYYYAADNNVVSELAVPIVQDKKVVGVINVESTRFAAFSSKDERAMIALAVQIGNYLSRRDYERKLRAIYEMQQGLAGAADLKEVYNKITHFASKILNFPIFSVNILIKKARSINLVSSVGYEDAGQYTAIPLNGEKGIVRYVATSGEEVIAQDVRADPRYLSSDSRVQSECAIPIINRHNILGVLNAEKFQKNGFSRDDIGLLRALARITGVFLKQKNLELQTRELFVLVEDLINIRDVVGVLEKLMKFVIQTFDYEYFSVSFVDPINKIVQLAACYGYDNLETIKRMDLNSSNSIVVKAAREGKPLNVHDVREDKAFISASSEIILSELAVPFGLEKGEGILGVLNVESCFIRAFNSDDQLILLQIGRIVAKAVQEFPKIDFTISM